MWYWNYPHMGYFGMFIPILFWIAIIWIIITLLRTDRSKDCHRGRDGSGGHKALEILKERYARGEISDEQYQKMKQQLEK